METTESELYGEMLDLLEMLKKAKPEERSELARRYAVTITELEKAIAYFKVFCVDENL